MPALPIPRSRRGWRGGLARASGARRSDFGKLIRRGGKTREKWGKVIKSSDASRNDQKRYPTSETTTCPPRHRREPQ